MRSRTAALALLAAFVAGGCQAGSPEPQATVSVSPPAPDPGHKVMIIAEENHGYDQVIGDSHAPYLNQLATDYGTATAYDAGYPAHCPSLAAYILMTSGDTGGICDDKGPGAHRLTGDNIVGVGSVLIDPPEGNMRDYLNSLERMRALPNLSVLFGGHGPAVAAPYRKIDEYISHRLEREQNILQAVREGATDPKQIVAKVYTDVSPKAYAMAERAVVAHLEKLREDGAI